MASEANTLPTPTLPTITDQSLRNTHLLYPSLQDVPDADLRQALMVRNQSLDTRLTGSGLFPPPTTTIPPTPSAVPRPTALEITTFRRNNPHLSWLSRGGIAATLLYDRERRRWLAEQLRLEHLTASAQGEAAPVFREPVWAAPRDDATPDKKIIAREPTDVELAEFRAQCASMVHLSHRHVRSVITYLRHRRKRKEARLRQRVLEQQQRYQQQGQGREEGLVVSEEKIRARIRELQDAQGSSVVRRGNLQRVQELQRLVAVERERQVGDGVMLDVSGGRRDWGTQTVAWALNPRSVEAVRLGVREDGSDEEGEGDDNEDEGVDVEGDDDEDEDEDEEWEGIGPLGQGSGGEDGYHDLFEEVHGELL